MSDISLPGNVSADGQTAPASKALCSQLKSQVQNDVQITVASTGVKGNSSYAPTMVELQKRQVRQTLVDYIPKVMGAPTYCFTMTFKPVAGYQRQSTKITAATAALRWFLHCLNTKCYGKGYRRGKYELGFYVTFEGLDVNDTLHCHGAIRLPKKLSHEKFREAFDHARRNTRLLGRETDLKEYRNTGWIEYTLKTGPDSFQPEFLRPGMP